MAQIKEAESLLIDEHGNIKPFEKFLRDVQKINKDYNERYLFSEHKFAVASAQMADKWARFEKDGDRYNLQYRTANDDRVRDTHAELHNITLPLDSPFWDSYFPPNGWGCRCTVVQVRKSKHPLSDLDDAMKRGEEATEGTYAKMFRFNPGKQRILFPEHNPYTPSRCAACSASDFPYAKTPDNEMCAACPLIREMAKKEIETWATIDTKSGKVRVSSLHGKQERVENIEIASYLAERYGYEIDLLRTKPDEKTADSFNKTLGFEQEYARNLTPTESAIDNAVRKSKNQANHIVLDVKSDIPSGLLRNAIQNRVRRSNNLISVTIIKDNEDKTYLRKDIIKPDWTL